MRYVTVLHCKDDESDIVDEFWNLEEGNSGPEERWHPSTRAQSRISESRYWLATLTDPGHMWGEVMQG